MGGGEPSFAPTLMPRTPCAASSGTTPRVSPGTSRWLMTRGRPPGRPYLSASAAPMRSAAPNVPASIASGWAECANACTAASPRRSAAVHEATSAAVGQRSLSTCPTPPSPGAPGPT